MGEVYKATDLEPPAVSFLQPVAPILMVEADPDAEPGRLHVIQHWHQELLDRVPVD